MTRRRLATLAVATLCLAVFAGRAAAHGGSLGATSRESLAIPTWLFLFTGGGAVGASFLLASFVTDRSLIARIHDWHRPLSLPGTDVVAAVVRALGVAALLAVLVVGFVGPAEPLANFAILLTWVGWWAGLTMVTYLLGNVWPVLNPVRTLAELLPTWGGLSLARAGAWPSVVGLLALVWLEVVSPVAQDPAFLAAVVGGYTLLTLAGAVAVGTDTWFRRVDPVARVFRYYGRVAVFTRRAGQFRFRLPGVALSEERLVDGLDEVAFVVALLWVTTYDGFVSTPLWADIAGAAVGAGVPPALVYPVALVLGFLVFYGAYRLAARLARRTGDTYRSEASLARAFAPSLLAIAAGYHLAHYLGYFLSLAPSLVSAATRPLTAPASVPILALPGWFGGVELAAVLLGHLLAIWVAHARAYELFPGRLQAIRSQYPFIIVMVLYTMTSLWIVSQPESVPPYLGL
jgi:hypothetical protein